MFFFFLCSILLNIKSIKLLFFLIYYDVTVNENKNIKKKQSRHLPFPTKYMLCTRTLWIRLNLVCMLNCAFGALWILISHTHGHSIINA